MEKILVVALALIYSLLTVLNIVWVVLFGVYGIWDLVSLAVGLLCSTGLWGCALNKGILNAKLWRYLAFILGASLVVSLISWVLGDMVAHHSMMTYVGMLVMTMLALSIVWVLYRYGNPDQEIWASQEYLGKGEALDGLLMQHGSLMIDKQQVDSRAVIDLEKIGGVYRIGVVRGGGDNEERFNKTFEVVASVADFMEKYTCVGVGDFENKYSRRTL